MSNPNQPPIITAMPDFATVPPEELAASMPRFVEPEQPTVTPAPESIVDAAPRRITVVDPSGRKPQVAPRTVAEHVPVAPKTSPLEETVEVPFPDSYRRISGEERRRLVAEIHLADAAMQDVQRPPSA